MNFTIFSKVSPLELKKEPYTWVNIFLDYSAMRQLTKSKIDIILITEMVYREQSETNVHNYFFKKYINKGSLI